MLLESGLKLLAQQAILSTVILAAFACDAQPAAPTESQRDIAFALEQQGDIAKAEAAWQAVTRNDPADAEAYAHLGLLEARQEHYNEAVAYDRKALSLNLDMPGLHLNLGLALFKAGDMKAAIQVFHLLLKKETLSSPDALRLITLLGLANYALGEYAESVPYLKQATAADPQNLPFRLALAQSCLWSKRYQCVLDVYHEILMLNADSAEADMLAGEALDEMKDKPGAVQQFQAAVKADPKEPGVHFGLGYLFWGLLQFDEAAKEFQAEVDNNPRHAQALTYLADSDIRLSQPDGAQPLLERAVGIDPKIELAHLDLGILLNDAGKRDEALRELKIAEHLNPDDQNVHWRLGRFYKSIGKNAESKAEFDKTRSLQKAADQTVLAQLHRAQEKGKPVPVDPDSPLQK
jgi:tetratricopeptide (TPR) repeat protein